MELTLNEFFDKYGNEYGWESTLEEDLIESDSIGDYHNYYPGDLVMVNDPIRGAHRILIISSFYNGDNNTFKGYLLSSKVAKSNINNKKFPNNIYIKDYSTILERGPKYHKEAFIKVDDLVEFTKDNLESGSFKRLADIVLARSYCHH